MMTFADDFCLDLFGSKQNMLLHGIIVLKMILPFDDWQTDSWTSIEKHFWKITKQIISVIKNGVLVFVKTNYFKCSHFSRSQIKVYQISKTYSDTITNRWEKFKTMVNYQIFLIFKMMIRSKVIRSAYLNQKTSHLHHWKLTRGIIGFILIYSCHNLHPNLIVMSLKHVYKA